MTRPLYLYFLLYAVFPPCISYSISLSISLSLWRMLFGETISNFYLCSAYLLLSLFSSVWIESSPITIVIRVTRHCVPRRHMWMRVDRNANATHGSSSTLAVRWFEWSFFVCLILESSFFNCDSWLVARQYVKKDRYLCSHRLREQSTQYNTSAVFCFNLWWQNSLVFDTTMNQIKSNQMKRKMHPFEIRSTIGSWRPSRQTVFERKIVFHIDCARIPKHVVIHDTVHLVFMRELCCGHRSSTLFFRTSRPHHFLAIVTPTPQ